MLLEFVEGADEDVNCEITLNGRSVNSMKHHENLNIILFNQNHQGLSFCSCFLEVCSIGRVVGFKEKAMRERGGKSNLRREF